MIVRCVYNKPTFWGIRCLNPSELANLWDVPLLVQEFAAQAGPDFHVLLHSFRESVPGKTLLLGIDYLLSIFLRGGVVFESRTYS